MTTDQPTLAVTLKPCPFCGGERARTIHIRDGRKVACICGACGKPEFHGPPDRPDAEARATTAWNTRTNSEPRPAGDLREALERLERANDAVAAATTRERYLTDLADVQPALLELDDARLAARNLLATHSHRPAAGSVTLFREVDALGGTGMSSEGESWSRGDSEALSDVLGVLTKRGFTEQQDATHSPAPMAGDKFNRGVLIAVATLINCWGAGTETAHLLTMIDATPEMVERMGFTDYDREPLLSALAAHRSTQEG